MAILVTGAAGTIGSEICRQLLHHNVRKVIGVDKSEIGIYNHHKKKTRSSPMVAVTIRNPSALFVEFLPNF